MEEASNSLPLPLLLEEEDDGEDAVAAAHLEYKAPCLPANLLVGLFWDMENIRVPRGFCPRDASNMIRRKLSALGLQPIAERRLYYDSRKSSEMRTDREAFDMSGFTLVDCPTRNAKETLDKKILVDMLIFANMALQSNNKPCIVLISSDGDYSYCLQRLMDIGAHTVVIFGPNTAPCLLDAANCCLNWRHDILQYPSPSVGRKTREGDGSPAAAAATATAAAAAAGGGLLPLPPMPSRSGRQLSREVSIHDEGVFLALLVALKNAATRLQDVQMIDDWTAVWTPAAAVASQYYVKVGHADKEAYRRTLKSALEQGFIETGHRDLAVPQARKTDAPAIIASMGAPANARLSTERYLRATEKALTQSSLVSPSISKQGSAEEA